MSVYLSVTQRFAAKSLLPKKQCDIKANVVSICLSELRIVARAVGWKSYTYVRSSVCLPFFLSFLISICMFVRPSVLPSVHPSVSPSVHPSFFPSLTSPSSLAPFSVSLIYIFLVSFSGSHVISLLSMCSNVHTTAYMQLLDFFYC